MIRRHSWIQIRRRILLASFIVSGSWLLAHSINGVVAHSFDASLHPVASPTLEVVLHVDPSTEQDRNRQLVQRILSSQLFAVPESSGGTSTPRQNVHLASAHALRAATKVSLKVSLLGIVGGVKDNSRAILEDVRSKTQALYRLGQLVPDIGEVAAIEKDRVLLRDGMQEEWLELAIINQQRVARQYPQQTDSLVSQTPQPLLTSTRRKIDRRRLVELTAHPETYLKAGQFQPHFTGTGKIDGFLVDAIQQVGVLEQAGLQNSDVLTAINGVEIRDPGGYGRSLNSCTKSEPSSYISYETVNPSCSQSILGDDSSLVITTAHSVRNP